MITELRSDFKALRDLSCHVVVGVGGAFSLSLLAVGTFALGACLVGGSRCPCLGTTKGSVEALPLWLIPPAIIGAGTLFWVVLRWLESVASMHALIRKTHKRNSRNDDPNAQQSDCTEPGGGTVELGPTRLAPGR